MPKFQSIRKALRLSILPLCLLACCSPLSAKASEVLLAWDPPTTNTDGTALTDLSAYKLYQGGVSQTYTSSYAIGIVTNYNVVGLREGSTYFFAVTAVNAAGRESAFSDELTWTAPDRTPPTISGLTNTTLVAGTNGQAAIPNFVSVASISDNVSTRANITVTQAPASGTLVALGARTVNVVATDQAGNSATSGVTVTVVDQTAPVISPLSDVTVVGDGSDHATVSDFTALAVVTDNCSARIDITVTQSPLAGATVGLGTNVVTVTARDKAGNQATRTVRFIVNPCNKAPVCVAGTDQTIQLPTDTLTLSGTASDDGLPTGSTLSATWSVVSGSGTVTFGNSHALSTTASFSVEGTYVLQLTVSDSLLTATDTITVTVKAPKKPMAPQRLRVLSSK